MAQHDYNIANQTGANFRADLNNALNAIATNNSGDNEPSTTFAYEWWIDTTDNVLKLRNTNNNAWITMPFSINADNTVDINAGTVNGITSLSFSSGSTVTSILDEDNLSSNSATALATQQSIKAYVDSQVTAQDLDISDGSSTISIDLDSETLSLLGGTGVTSTASGNGVTFAIGQPVGTSDNVVFNQVTGALVGNASTATALATARTISGVSFDGTANITLDTDDIGEGSSNLYYTDARVQAISINNVVEDTTPQLGGNLDVNGQDIVSVSNGNITLTPNGTGVVRIDGSTGVDIQQGSIKIKNGGTQSYIDFYCEFNNAHYLRLQAPAHSAFSGNPTVTLPNTAGTIALTSSNISGNSATASQLETARAIALAGDVVGTANFDGSADISITTTIQPNSVALATDTTGNFVAEISGTTNEIEVSGSGSENATVTIGLPDDVTVSNDLTVAGNLTVTGTTTQTGSVVTDSNFQGFTDNNTGNVTDFGIYGKYVESSTTKFAGLFYDASTDNTFRLFADTQTKPTTTVNTGATGYTVAALVANLTGNVTGNVTGDVTGNSDTATALANGRTIALSGDVTATGVSFDGTGNITLSTTIASDSVSLGSDTTGNYIATIAGTTNEIEVSGSGSESATVTIGLPDDVTIAGNLTVNGTTTTVNSDTLAVTDPLIKLAKSNSGADSLDIGFYGLYDTSGSQDLYAGLFRDANDSGKFKLFKDLQVEPTTTVNTSGTGFAVATLVSNLEGDVTGNVTGQVSTLSNHDTDNLSEGSGNLYFTNSRADTRINLQTGANLDLSSKSTSNLSEGTNLYYTDARFDTRLGTKTTDNITEGSNNLYYTDARFDTRLAAKTTDNLTEGSSNLYMTTERVQDIVGGMVTGNTETGITVTYDDSDGTLDFIVGTLNQDTTGNAATATALETARTIGGTSFDGTSNISIALADTATILANARTINGVSFDGSANITTLTAGTGVSVSGTEVAIGQAVASSDSPTFLNLTLNGTDSIKVPAGTTAQRNGSPAAGMLRYNSTTGEFEGYTNAWGAIGGGSGSFSTNIFAGDGSDTTFTLSAAPSNENNLLVFIDGVFQAHDVYSVSGTTLTFATAPANGRVITVYNAEEVSIGTPSDNSVSTVKIQDDAVTSAKLDTNISIAGTLASTGVLTANAGVVVDNITIDGQEIDVSSGDLTVDVAGNLKLDADGGEFQFEDGGTRFLEIANSSSDVIIRPTVQDKDLKFNGNDGGSAITALTLDMSAAGQATFNAGATFGDNVSITSTGDGLSLSRSGYDTYSLQHSTGNGMAIRNVTDSRTEMHFAGDGSIGIGTSNPDSGQILDVRGNVRIGDGSAIEQDIHFESANGSWQVGSNDSGSGTSNNQFYIYDSNSSSYPFTVQRGGNVGINCSAGYDFEVRTNDTSTEPQQVIRQIGSGDAALGFQIPSANNWYIGVDNSDSDIFKIGSGLTVGTTSHVNINSSGQVLMGTTSVVDTNCTALHTKATASTKWVQAMSGVDRGMVKYTTATSGTVLFDYYIYNGSVVGSISSTGSSTAYNTSSDYRLKENVDYDFNALDRVAQLKPARFNFISDADITLDGFLAHEVQDIVPEAITGEKDGVKEEEYEVSPAILDDDGNVVTEAEMGTREVPDYQGIDQSKLVPLLTKAIQEQQTIIEDLKSRIEILEGA